MTYRNAVLWAVLVFVVGFATHPALAQTSDDQLLLLVDDDHDSMDRMLSRSGMNLSGYRIFRLDTDKSKTFTRRFYAGNRYYIYVRGSSEISDIDVEVECGFDVVAEDDDYDDSALVSFSVSDSQDCGVETSFSSSDSGEHFVSQHIYYERD